MRGLGSGPWDGVVEGGGPGGGRKREKGTI